MKIYEVIQKILENPSKTFKAKQKPYMVKISSTGGLSIIKTVNKTAKTNTLDITGEIINLEWEESRKQVSLVEALKQTIKRIRPCGNYAFDEVSEWLFKLCDASNKKLLDGFWEIE